MMLTRFSLSYFNLKGHDLAKGTRGRLNASVCHKAQWSVLRTSLGVLHAAWPAVDADPRIDSTVTEDSITDLLRQQMVAVKNAMKPRPRLRFEREPQSDAVGDDTPLGLIDIMVCYTWNEMTHLVIECKRIWSKDNTLALAYVKDGVSRFASGKYSAGHALGAMVGYVLCGNTTGCVSRVKTTLSGQPVKVTGYDKKHGWKSDKTVLKLHTVGKTRHSQKSHRYKITLVHSYVEVS